MKTFKKYAKVINIPYGLCAIYEPHPFRSKAISGAIGEKVDTGIEDDAWTWVYYDFCGNPIGVSEDKPEGTEVDKLTFDNTDWNWTTPECAQNIIDYLNKESE